MLFRSSFTWKYYTDADLAAAIGATTDAAQIAYYTRLLDYSAANGNVGAVVITGLTATGTQATALDIPSAVGRDNYATLFTGGNIPTASSMPVVGIENSTGTLQNGVFTSLTLNNGLRAIAPNTFDSCAQMRNLYWNIKDIKAGTTTWTTAVEGAADNANETLFVAANEIGRASCRERV